MPKRMNRTIARGYAAPAFYNAPPASSLPIPKFSKRSSSVSDALPHRKQSSNESESISATSDKSQNGMGIASATIEQNRSIDIVKEPSATFTASASRSVAFEKLAEQTREYNEARASFLESQRHLSEFLELEGHQQLIINSIESSSTNAIIRSVPQGMIGRQYQKPPVPASVHGGAQEMQHMWTSRRFQALGPLAAELVLLKKRTVKFLLQRTKTRLEQLLSKLRQQRLDESNEAIKQEGTLATNEVGVTTSSDEVTQTGNEIDKLESDHGEIVLPGVLNLAANAWKTMSGKSGETSFEAGSEADQEIDEAEEGEGLENLEDEGHCSMKEMVEEPDVLLYGPVGGPLQRISGMDDLPEFLASTSAK